MTRRTTVVHLHGAGDEGVGEDVSYDGDLQLAFTDDALPDLRGEHTLDAFSGARRRPAGLPPVGARVGRARPRAPPGGPLARRRRRPRAAAGALRRLAERRRGAAPALPEIRFKLDASDKWTADVVAELAATGAVDVVDLKGLYEGDWVDATPSAELYGRVAESFPDAWLEDARLPTRPRPCSSRTGTGITWDFPIHSVADVDALPFPPACLNSKPSRFGSVRNLFDFYDACEERGIAMYGGGQFELGPGRGQIQHLASLFHADAPNDVAPKEFNDGPPRPGLPQSPLPPAPAKAGFR